ncbi:acyl-CoA thioester hydrolase [Campylobacterota bacterium]|nr:acyl-CoA thioester hydrolase [Campylobacterota bacterium]
MKIRVYYEDTDSLGIVYHANYLKFIERARSEAFFALGSKPEGEGFCFVVRSMKIRFIRSAKLGDHLEVKSTIIEIRAASFWLKQEIFLDGAAIFSAEVELAHLCGGKLAKIGGEFLHSIERAFAA